MRFIKDYLRTLLESYRLSSMFRTYKVLQNVHFEEMKYERQRLLSKNVFSIAFLIPGLPRYSGGHTSILRLGTYLQDFGNEVSYVTIDRTSASSMAKNAALNLPNYRGQVLDRTHINKNFDIGIATSWLTAYSLCGKENFGYKCYLVQDFEPFFYERGDLFLLALKTYRLGFHMISLGPWNAMQIEQHAGRDLRVDVIDFPFDADSYGMTERRISIGDRIRIAAYVKLLGRRAPILLFESLDLLGCQLKARGVEPEILIFGLDRRTRVPVGKNLGRLCPDRLADLYRRCDLGIVASMTNMSLVPYEMIACGLPVVEFAEGSVLSFLDEDSMIFSASLPGDVVSKITYYIDHQNELNKVVRNAQQMIREMTWERSALQLVDRIQKAACHNNM